jgi:alpha-tubulin suppressor-like RCC1 family protein
MVSGGGKHACGMAANTPYCWGQNNAGQLGRGNLINSNVAVAVTIPSRVSVPSVSVQVESTPVP